MFCRLLYAGVKFFIFKTMSNEKECRIPNLSINYSVLETIIHDVVAMPYCLAEKRKHVGTEATTND